MGMLDVVTGLNAAILARVPAEHHAEVKAMQSAITQVYESALQSAEAQAFMKGVETAEQREAESQESGFHAGYRRGLEQAWGHIGSPAHRLDEDEASEPS